MPHFVSCLRSLLISGSCICWHDWWDLLQSCKPPWVTSLPFPAWVPAASCPQSVTASPSPHLVIKPRLYTVGVQVSICLHDHCQQLYIISCQGCFKAMESCFSGHRDQVFLHLNPLFLGNLNVMLLLLFCFVLFHQKSPLPFKVSHNTSL